MAWASTRGKSNKLFCNIFRVNGGYFVAATPVPVYNQSECCSQNLVNGPRRKLHMKYTLKNVKPRRNQVYFLKQNTMYLHCAFFLQICIKRC